MPIIVFTLMALVIGIFINIIWTKKYGSSVEAVIVGAFLGVLGSHAILRMTYLFKKKLKNHYCKKSS
jgi:hypothetical protein